MDIDQFAGYKVIEHESEWELHGPAGTIIIPRDGRWTFNGDYRRPTFQPSVNESWGTPGQTYEDFKKSDPTHRSHLYVRDGRVEYLNDCTHEYAGQTHGLDDVNPVAVASALSRQGKLD